MAGAGARYTGRVHLRRLRRHPASPAAAPPGARSARDLTTPDLPSLASKAPGSLTDRGLFCCRVRFELFRLTLTTHGGPVELALVRSAACCSASRSRPCSAPSACCVCAARSPAALPSASSLDSARPPPTPRTPPLPASAFRRVADVLVDQRVWLRVVGGAFLVYLGVRTVLAPPAQRSAEVGATRLLGAYASTLALTRQQPDDDPVVRRRLRRAGPGHRAPRQLDVAARCWCAGVFRRLGHLVAGAGQRGDAVAVPRSPPGACAR